MISSYLFVCQLEKHFEVYNCLEQYRYLYIKEIKGLSARQKIGLVNNWYIFKSEEGLFLVRTLTDMVQLQEYNK